MISHTIKKPRHRHTEPHMVLQPNQKGLQFRASKKQALLVFDKLIERLQQKGIPYNSALVPQAEHALPDSLKKGTRQHAVFLFVLCLWMRGGTESDTAMRFLAPLFDKKPELFVPEYFLDTNTLLLIEEVSKALIEFNLGQRVEENSVGWVYNMRKIARHWDGDPRKLMNDKPSFELLCRRIISKKPKTIGGGILLNEDNPNGFMYFQEKMAGMIAYFLMDAQLVPMFYAPVPVDIHVLRILVINRIIQVAGKSEAETVGIDFYREEVRVLARAITEWYCRKRKVSPVALCDTLWLLSRSLCRRNPGNSGYVVDSKRQKGDRLRRKRSREDRLSPLLAGFETGGERPADSASVDSGSADPATVPVGGETESDAGLLSGRKRYMGLRFDEKEIWKDEGRVKRFHASCGRCPLNGTCGFNVSSGAYYVAGKLLVERERLIAPDDHGSFLHHEAFAAAHHVRVDPRVRFAPIAFVE